MLFSLLSVFIFLSVCAEMNCDGRNLRHAALKLSVSIIVSFAASALKIHDTRRL